MVSNPWLALVIGYVPEELSRGERVQRWDFSASRKLGLGNGVRGERGNMGHECVSEFAVAAPEIQCYQVIARSITQPTRSRENRETLKKVKSMI